MPDAHGAKPAPSSWHSNVLSSLEENTNVSRLTACSAPSPGPDAPNVTVGATVSTTQVNTAGTRSNSPPSRARTRNVCVPSARFV